MLTKIEADRIAIKRIHQIFGLEYLKANREGSCTSRGYWPEQGESMLFVGIKDSNDLPNHVKSRKGWTVYAEIWVDTITGKIKREEYLTE